MGLFSRLSGIVWRCCLSFMALIIALLATAGGHAQVPSAGGQVFTPESSIEKPGDNGVRAHTNIQIFLPNHGAGGGRVRSDVAGSGAPQPPGVERVGGGARRQ
jgi:hypothetical protein